MSYTLSNKCAKNLCKRTVPLQLIIKNVVTCFLEHSVDQHVFMNMQKVDRTGNIVAGSFDLDKSIDF